jgi:hypothetical protein
MRVLAIAPAEADSARGFAVGMNYAAGFAALLAFAGAVVVALCRERRASRTSPRLGLLLGRDVGARSLGGRSLRSRCDMCARSQARSLGGRSLRSLY